MPFLRLEITLNPLLRHFRDVLLNHPHQKQGLVPEKGLPRRLFRARHEYGLDNFLVEASCQAGRLQHLGPVHSMTVRNY